MNINDRVQVTGTASPVLNSFTGTVLEIEGGNVLVQLDNVPEGYEFPEGSSDVERQAQWFAKSFLSLMPE